MTDCAGMSCAVIFRTHSPVFHHQNFFNMKLLEAMVTAAAFAAFASGCKEPAEQQQDPTASKIDSVYAQIADLTIEQMKLTTKYVNLPQVTATIEAYSKAKTISDKIRIVDAFKPNEQNKADACDAKATPRGNYVISTRFDPAVNPQNFDLYLRNNDVAVQQIKLMNSYFNDLDKNSLDAIAFYEQLDSAAKTKLFFLDNSAIAQPDYAKRWMAREFQMTYQLQKAAMMQMLQRYMLQRRYINEFPQGFRTTTLNQQHHPHQFDLAITVSQP